MRGRHVDQHLGAARIQLDPAARIARVAAGAVWDDVVEPAATHGLAALVGSSTKGGVVGYTLGGGFGWLGRKYSLAVHSVTRAEVVTADADLVSTGTGRPPGPGQDVRPSFAKERHQGRSDSGGSWAARQPGSRRITGRVDPRRRRPVQGRGLRDRASLRAAMKGVDSVFLACGNIADQVAHEWAVIDEAARAGVRQIVKLSARGATAGASVAYWRWHGQIERRLKTARVPAVLLQPSLSTANLLVAADHVRQRGMLYAPAGLARISMIDPADVAAVAAVALTTEGHAGRTYVLTGREAITYAQVAADLSAATGRSVSYANIPPEAAGPALVDAGMPPFAAEQIVAVFADLRKGAQGEITDTVRTLTGRAGHPLADFARDHSSAFRTGGVPVGA